LKYSIVIPAYNESRRIVSTLNQVLSFIAANGWDAELIVVNDGSRDDTAEIVKQYVQRNSMMMLIENPGNRGKGFSIRNGMLKARGDVLLFSDADLSAPIEEAPKLLDAIDAGADIAMGSRWLKPELQKQRQSLHRQFLGRVFNLLLRVVLGLDFADTQCGFKAFSRRAAQAVFKLQRIERWGFDPEIIYLAKKQGFRVVEIPVQWSHDDKTTIHPVRDGLRMFLEVLKVRWNSICGKYEVSGPTSPASDL
jgi:glycosyltransferase involved in cell wall biosynthesis